MLVWLGISTRLFIYHFILIFLLNGKPLQMYTLPKKRYEYNV